MAMTDKELLIRIRVESPEMKAINTQLDLLKEKIKVLSEVEKDNNGLTKIQAQRMQEAKEAAAQLIVKKNEQAQAEKKLEAINKTAEGSMARLRAETSLMVNQANNMVVKTKEEEEARKKLMIKITENKEKIRDFDRSISGSNTLVGEYSRGINDSFRDIKGSIMDSLNKAGGSVTNILGDSGKGIIGAFAALSIGIGGVVATVKTFRSVIESADSSEDEWRRVTESSTIALDALKKAVATGDFSNFVESIREAVKFGGEYADVLDKIQDYTREYSVREAELKNEIALKRIEQTNANLTNDEQIEAGKEILEKEKELADFRKSTALLALNNEADKISLLTGLDREQVLGLVSKFRSMEDAIEVGKKYNKEMDAIIKLQAKFPQQGTEWALKIQEINNRYGELGMQAGQYARKTAKFSDEERDKIKELYVDYFNAEAQFNESTLKVQKKINKDIAEENKKKEEQAKKDHEEEIKRSEERIKQAKKESEAKNDGLASEQAAFIAFDNLMQKKQDDAVNKADVTKQKKLFVPGVGYVDEATYNAMQVTSERKAKETADNIAKLEEADLREVEARLKQKTEMIAIASDSIAEIMQGVTDGSIKTFGDVSNILVKMGFDFLKRMVPVWIAEATGISITEPDAVATFGATAVARVVALTAILEGAVSIAEGAVTGAMKKGKAGGGVIQAGDGIPLKTPTPIGDNQLIFAKRGEVILNENQQRMLGYETFKAIGVPGFASGGMVGGLPGRIELNGGTSLFDYEKLARMINEKQVILNMNDLSSGISNYNRVKTRMPL